MEKIDQVEVLSCLESVKTLGFDSPRVQFRQIRGKLWEIKIYTPNAGFRFFYVCLRQDLLVLLHAYKKQSQKIPSKEIKIAEKRLSEVLRNENCHFR